MSFVSGIAGVDVWNPALQGGRVPAGYAQALSELIDVPPALSLNSPEMIEIDGLQLQALVGAVRQISELLGPG